MRECPKCGNTNDDENKFCITCASPLDDLSKTSSKQSTTPNLSQTSNKLIQSSGRKEPVLTAVISLLPGVGHMYIGQMTKGIILLAATVLLSCFTGGILYIFLAIFAALDAYKLTEKLNEGNPIEEMEFFFQKK